MDEDYEKLAYLCESNVFYNGKNIEKEKIRELTKIFGKSLELFSQDTIDYYRKEKEVYALFTLYYSNGYFSVQQCIEIDSLRKAIDELEKQDLYISNDKQVLLVCLLHALSEIVSSVGKNFAQPIKVVDGNGNIKKFAIKRCMRDRKLSIKDAFKGILNEINADRKLFSNNQRYFLCCLLSWCKLV